MQLAYVVADIDAAVTRWLNTTTAGPFFRARFDLTGQSYRGGQVEAAIEVALAYRDNVLIELIQPADDHPSIYHEVMRARGPGVHHVMLATADIDADVARHEAAGHALIASGQLTGFGRAVFVDTFTELGHFIEYRRMDSARAGRNRRLQICPPHLDRRRSSPPVPADSFA